eukprot:TRINITY_DN123_c0_g3_i1.p1 TRINITY_DN123_c0_g3~~TRINITY_DN123_c0_g3_i1.p1  ORF type:complete len:186 (-),score=30.14 TRINITY_DN123_c0_g3_i1:260-817(-)
MEKSSISSQQSTLEAYINAIKASLDVALCLRDFPSEIVEKDNKPEVELQGYQARTKPLLLNPIYIARSDKEKCLIEPSINSCRVSFLIKQNDELDKLIAERFSKYWAVRADQFEILRRVPLKGYDVSFLITAQHLERFEKRKLIDYIANFVEIIEKELNEVKLNIGWQCRIAATYYVNSISLMGQ